MTEPATNNVRLSLLRYRLPLGEDSTLYIAAQGNGFVDLDASAQLTPYTDGSAVGLFALRNPIYNYSSGTGIGFRQFFLDDFVELNLGYLASDANNPNVSRRFVQRQICRTRAGDFAPQ
ncbi:MAG: hypothetical protein HC895_18945 [Leptolyngbyaceae cyanobacterium SM1_3_5]|nr:hypothetical protein [Leptolyngbyaceae cyanobacterium SM1_3_5]